MFFIVDAGYFYYTNIYKMIGLGLNFTDAYITFWFSLSSIAYMCGNYVIFYLVKKFGFV